MKLTDFNIRKINIEDVDANYSGQDILFKLGELYQYESGIYGLGNIWVKLQRNVENIIIEELDKVGCIQVQFPTLQPKIIWEMSDRWKNYVNENDIMFITKTDKNDYGMAPTAEECATLFAADRLKSYKNLPATYYQIGEKFRKELRSRGYLLRPKTFIMLDAYSFDKDEESMAESYEKINQAYVNIFGRIGLKVIPIIADNGTMGGKKSEEWMTLTELGEDTILYDENSEVGLNIEVLEKENYQEYLLKEYGINNIDNMKEKKALELGHNFQLGTKYSDSMKLFFSNNDNTESTYYMGCYGIGVSRMVAVIIENSIIKDNGKIKALSLPENIAPYLVQIIYKEEDIEKQKLAETLYVELENNKIGSIIDNRSNIAIGARIKDALILGCPYIAIIGDKSDSGMIEIEDKRNNKKMILNVNEAIEFFKNIK